MSENAEQPKVTDLLQEMVCFQALLFRRQCESQGEAILALDQAGFQPKRIAELMNAKVDTVRKTIQRAQ